jgi:hypothetical protein
LSNEAPEDRVVTHLVKEVQRLVESQRSKYGDSFAQSVEMNFLARYISVLATESLIKFTKTKTKSKSEYDLVSQSFSNFKATLQEAVAMAFSVAMTDFAGKPVEYFCNLQMIQDPPSRNHH